MIHFTVYTSLHPLTLIFRKMLPWHKNVIYHQNTGMSLSTVIKP